MARIYGFEGIVPVVPASAYVHPEAVLIGDVIIGERCYIGPNACLRGDFGRIIVKDGANVQDNCVLHSFPNKDLVIETNGHIGHGAILHGCVVGQNALIGMNAVIMDGVTIGANSFVGAHAFVKAGMQIPENHLAAGSPATVVRPLSEQEIGWKTRGTGTYQQLAQRCLHGLYETEPLPVVEPDRPRCQWSEEAEIELRDVKRQPGE